MSEAGERNVGGAAGGVRRAGGAPAEGGSAAPDREIIGRILKAVAAAESIVITSHVEPDGDAYGSVFGLSSLLRENFPDKRIWTSFGPEAAARAGDQAAGNRAPTDSSASAPPARAVIHTGGPNAVPAGMRSPPIDSGGAFSFFPRPDDVPDAVIAESLVMALDTANGPRVIDPRWARGAGVVKIDHHPAQEGFGDIEWVDTSYPSCAEMIVDIMTAGNLSIPACGADFLLFGIITDTGRFRYPSVTERTFERVSRLFRAGAVPARIYDSLYFEEERVLRFRGHVYRNFKVTPEGLAFLKIPDDILNEYGISSAKAGRMVNLLSDLGEARVWAFFCQDGAENTIKVELRSRSLPVNAVAARFGGGGHRLAAGIRVPDWETADAVIADITRELRAENAAADQGHSRR